MLSPLLPRRSAPCSSLMFDPLVRLCSKRDHVIAFTAHGFIDRSTEYLVLCDDGGVEFAAEERAGADLQNEILEAATAIQIGVGDVVGDYPFLK